MTNVVVTVNCMLSVITAELIESSSMQMPVKNTMLILSRLWTDNGDIELGDGYLMENMLKKLKFREGAVLSV